MGVPEAQEMLSCPVGDRSNYHVRGGKQRFGRWENKPYRTLACFVLTQDELPYDTCLV